MHTFSQRKSCSEFNKICYSYQVFNSADDNIEETEEKGKYSAVTLGNRAFGFTLAELLIALAILGVIATFTIPKIITAQVNSQFKAVAKEDISALSAAFNQLQLNGGVTSGTKPSDLIQYLNYVELNTGPLSIDERQTLTTKTCSAFYRCLKMHNGSVLYFDRDSGSLGGTNTTNGMWIMIDPDGKITDGTTNGPGKSMNIWIYANGRVADEGSLAAGTRNNNAAQAADPSIVPPWFSW